MQAVAIEGATRIIGKSQGYIGLALRDEDRDGTPCMVSAWEPTPDELARLNAGATIHLCILGTGHPPVNIEVGDRP